jgi:hypothetical protein
LWKATGQEYVSLEIRKRTFRWNGHTLRKDDGKILNAALQWKPQGSRRQENQEIVGEYRLSKKRGEIGMNQCFWQLVDRNGKDS